MRTFVLADRRTTRHALTLSFSSRFALSIVWITLGACGGETTIVDPATAVSKVAISAAYTSLAVGSTIQLTAEATNAAGTVLVGKTVNWASSRPDVATITSLGLVMGKATGIAVITATSEGRSGSLTLTVQAPNTITLTSDVGDYIGQGAAYSYTNASAIIRVTANASSIGLSISGDQAWTATFQAQSGAQLATGVYSNATRFPFQGGGPGLSWSGEGRGCNTLTGFFIIDSLSWTAGPASPLLALDLRFEQHCEGGAAALHGTIHWRADDPTKPPGPVTPPANLWQPPAGATPTTGNFVYLQSEQGDYIGAGAVNLYQTGITVSVTGARIAISVGGYNSTFQGMNSITELKAGYYGNLMRYPFNNPARGGFDWSGNGRGCNELLAWFVIDRVNYVNGLFAGVEARFEQHCDGLNPALHGAIRWGQLS